MNTLGERLKDLRKSYNLNQDELTNIINSTFRTSIVRPMISKWENNKEYPRIDFIKYLCKYFNVSVDYLTCNSNFKNPLEEVANTPELIPKLQSIGKLPTGDLIKVPILGNIKAGYNFLPHQDLLGYEYVDKSSLLGKNNCFFLKICGDSMYPMFIENDLVLINPMPDVDTGSIAAVIIDNEEATLKRIIKQDNSVILQPLNTLYPPKIFKGNELSYIKIIGKVIQCIRKFD